MISAVSISRILISFAVRSIILCQSRYFSVPGVREAEAVLPVNLSGETAPFVSLPQPCKILLQFFASPPTGDSTCPAHCSTLLKEISNFISNLRLFPAVSWGFSFFYLVLHCSLIPLDMFCECSVLGLTLKWYVQSVCLFKNLWLALWTGRYLPLAKSR